MAEGGEGGKLPSVDHVPLNEGAMGKKYLKYNGNHDSFSYNQLLKTSAKCNLEVSTEATAT
jgi:hypothetical protein